MKQATAILVSLLALSFFLWACLGKLFRPKPADAFELANPALLEEANTSSPTTPGTYINEQGKRFSKIGVRAKTAFSTRNSSLGPDEERTRRTAERLSAFLGSGDVSQLRAIAPEDARDYARLLATQYGRGEIARLAQEFCSIPEDLIPQDQGQLEDFLLGWFYALRGDSEEQTPSTPSPPQPVSIAFATNAVGPMTSTWLFPQGIPCVYGIFENSGDAAGLNWVMAVWRDLSTDRIAFQECEPVRANTPFNYVWLNVPAGWPVGHCQLELLDPNAGFRSLGQGRFHIQERKNSL